MPVLSRKNPVGWRSHAATVAKVE